MNKNKGFTLIELLVVIAIIGILSSVVLASLNTARNKGNDAAIKNNLANMRPQAEMYYDTNSGYSSVTVATLPVSSCTTPNSVFMENTITSMRASITNANAAPTCVLGGTSGSRASSWSVSAPLKGGGSWCVDSTGASVSGTDSNTDGKCGA